MTSAAPVPSRPPRWLLITLGVLAVFFLLGAIFGAQSPPPVRQQAAAPASPTPTSTRTSTSVAPPPDVYTVVSVVNAATVEVTDPRGARKTVQVLGVKAPAASGCFAPESVAWATTQLLNQRVTLTSLTATATDLTASLALADGSDYATRALQTGYVRAADAAVSALRTAEAQAHAAAVGLWAPPCAGDIDHPAPAPAPAPAKPKVTTTEAEPAPAPTEDESDSGSAPYYPNCAAARAAHAAPLYRGEPGYSSKLDRDNDGVACE
ncbi:excalibur calcium-binding domain-containing protein [Amycolatopsis bartoniae]|nr:excalibur calcium-binding domain-containing protein [Amycolatopsis bartoniae]